ncbi:MAG TPA: DUF1501 domain-containing protein [Chloroflexota bacterium]|nr:DUF1501 domain-containing protein [Chloroflexota bacterium]
MSPSASGKGNGKTEDPVLVVIQLSGGNDFMNTLVPFTQGVYYDSRPVVSIPEDKVLPINDTLGFHPSAEPMRQLFQAGSVAVVQGIGYQNSSRSHFRAMDIWHTCEPNKIATEGWLAKVIRELDPKGENPLTGVSFGRGLPRAMAAPGVTATSVDNLDNYGMMNSIQVAEEREQDLDVFKRMYTPAVGTGLVMDYLCETGQCVLTGAELLKEAPRRYTSTVQYADNPIAKGLRDVVRVHTAGLGTRIFYTQHPGYDHHAQEIPTHAKLLGELSGAITDLMRDLREHDAADNVAILVFTEFGRRVKDNGSGTDHGSGGGALIIGDTVQGGLYAEYPPLAHSEWLNGEDLRHTIDFRGIYGTMLEQWLGVDPVPIVGGQYEQVRPFKSAGGA